MVLASSLHDCYATLNQSPLRISVKSESSSPPIIYFFFFKAGWAKAFWAIDCIVGWAVAA